MEKTHERLERNELFTQKKSPQSLYFLCRIRSIHASPIREMFMWFIFLDFFLLISSIQCLIQHPTTFLFQKDIFFHPFHHLYVGDIEPNCHMPPRLYDDWLTQIFLIDLIPLLTEGKTETMDRGVGRYRKTATFGGIWIAFLAKSIIQSKIIPL